MGLLLSPSRAVAAPAGAVLRSLLDLILPGRCAGCGAAVPDVLCEACLGACEAPAGPACLRCGEGWTPALAAGECGRCARFGRPFAFEAAAALWRYRGPARALVHAFKYHGRRDVLLPLGARLANCPRLAPLRESQPLVVAVPARAASRRRRGYDQALELAAGLARAARLDFEPGALRRRRASGPQAGRTRAQRRRQAAAAFRASVAAVAGRQVLLVDDVLSTGATADACARALRVAGARRVVVASLAT